jgi:aminopeptidase N
MAIRVTVPQGLTCIANGRLRGLERLNGQTRFDWFVSYPINNYNVTVNIADYLHFSDVYIAQDGDSLELDYYVLRENEEKARRHFQQVPQVLACFERYFGKYPFWDDGYALVETPYLGMEHQGAIAYGNQYKRGYLGGMIPRDMDWDYIIVHETGHEYFGNSISCGDLSEMWIHESFTTYMEALYVECAYGYEDAVRYLRGQKPFIYNREPILGPRDVNWEDWEGSDHYFKGAWVLHTLRHAINDDAKWWELLRGFYDRYALSITTTEDVIDYVNSSTGQDYRPFFEQYLTYPDIPALEYRLKEHSKGLLLECRWDANVPAFAMPLLVGRPGAYQQIAPTTEWQSFRLEKITKQEFEIPMDLFLIRTKKR